MEARMSYKDVVPVTKKLLRDSTGYTDYLLWKH